MGPGAHDVPYGAGVSDVPALLAELKAQGFAGNISIEYEYHWENSTPEVGQCIGFVRATAWPRIGKPRLAERRHCLARGQAAGNSQLTPARVCLRALLA